jgi:hypothetical protein
MVTPTNGTAIFQPVRGGTPITVDFYISDVLAAPVTWSLTGAAISTSDTFIKFDQDVVLTDLSIATGPTVMTGLFAKANAALINGAAFRIANFLNNIQSRPTIAVGFKANKNIQLIQF